MVEARFEGNGTAVGHVVAKVTVADLLEFKKMVAEECEVLTRTLAC